MDKENFLIDLAAIDMEADVMVDNNGEQSLNNLLDKINALKTITRNTLINTQTILKKSGKG